MAYNNLKQKWKKLIDTKRTGSGLVGKQDSKWLKVIDLNFIDINAGLEDTSFHST